MVFLTGMEAKPKVWANTQRYVPTTETSTPISLFMLPVLLSGTSHAVTVTLDDVRSPRLPVREE